MNRSRNIFAIVILLFTALLLTVEVASVSAQVTTVRPPTRRPRNSNTIPRRNAPPGAGASFSVSQGLGSCDSGLFDDNGYARIREFPSRYYVLGLAPADGYPVDYSESIVSFWIQPDANNTIEMTVSDLQAVSQEGGDVWSAVLIGIRVFTDGTWDMFAIGRCANYFNDAGVAFMYDLWTIYYNDSATSPNRSTPRDIARVSPSPFVTPDPLAGFRVDPENSFSSAQGTSPTPVPDDGLDLRIIQFGSSNATLSARQVIGYQFSAIIGESFLAEVTSNINIGIEFREEDGTILVWNHNVEGGYNTSLLFEAPYGGTFNLVLYAASPSQSGSYQLDFNYFDDASACLNLPSPQLYIGASITPTSDNRPRVRADTNTNAEILGQMNTGNVATVMEGPVCDDSRYWWYINFNGVYGWSAEVDNDSEYLLRVR